MPCRVGNLCNAMKEGRDPSLLKWDMLALRKEVRTGLGLLLLVGIWNHKCKLTVF